MLGILSPFATSQVRIYLYAKDVDMRKSFDGLSMMSLSQWKVE